MKTIDLSGKVAIVTGGGSSIGAAITIALNQAGAKVVIGQRSQPVDEIANQCNGNVIFQQTDITDDSQLDALVSSAAETFGGIDIVVNNSAVVDDQGYLSSRQQWQNTLNTNLVSHAMLVQKALPYLEQSELRSVVNISSCTANFGVDLLLPYPTSKAALNSLTKGLAAQLASKGIRVNAVAPGATVSPQILEMAGKRERADQAAAHAQPLNGGRLANASEIAQAVLFLCSDMAQFTTGAILPVDGGYAALGPENTTASIFGRLSEIQNLP